MCRINLILQLLLDKCKSYGVLKYVGEGWLIRKFEIDDRSDPPNYHRCQISVAVILLQLDHLFSICGRNGRDIEHLKLT